MNAKLKQLLEKRKAMKKTGKGNFKQTTATKLPDRPTPKKGPSGAGPEGVKTPVKPKKVNESVPAFGSRFNRLWEQTLTENQNFLAEDDASDLYYEYDMMNDEDYGDADMMGGESEGGDNVTLTLDKQTAQMLLDLLQAAVGGGEEEGEMEELEGGEEEEVTGESKDDEDEDEDKEVVEEEGSYSMTSANLGAGAKLAQPGSKTVKSKLGARPGKAGNVKTYDSSGKLTAVGAPKQLGLQVKSNMSSAGKDLF